MSPWFFWEECHEAILPPIWNMVVLPHKIGQFKNRAGSIWPPVLHLRSRQSGGTRAFANRKVPSAMFEFLEGEGSVHGKINLSSYISG
jgi:hypothetical protein